MKTMNLLIAVYLLLAGIVAASRPILRRTLTGTYWAPIEKRSPPRRADTNIETPDDHSQAVANSPAVPASGSSTGRYPNRGRPKSNARGKEVQKPSQDADTQTADAQTENAEAQTDEVDTTSPASRKPRVLGARHKFRKEPVCSKEPKDKELAEKCRLAGCQCRTYGGFGSSCGISSTLWGQRPAQFKTSNNWREHINKNICLRNEDGSGGPCWCELEGDGIHHSGKRETYPATCEKDHLHYERCHESCVCGFWPDRQQDNLQRCDVKKWADWTGKPVKSAYDANMMCLSKPARGTFPASNGPCSCDRSRRRENAQAMPRTQNPAQGSEMRVGGDGDMPIDPNLMPPGARPAPPMPHEQQGPQDDNNDNQDAQSRPVSPDPIMQLDEDDVQMDEDDVQMDEGDPVAMQLARENSMHYQIDESTPRHSKSPSPTVQGGNALGPGIRNDGNDNTHNEPRPAPPSSDIEMGDAATAPLASEGQADTARPASEEEVARAAVSRLRPLYPESQRPDILPSGLLPEGSWAKFHTPDRPHGLQDKQRHHGRDYKVYVGDFAYHNRKTTVSITPAVCRWTKGGEPGELVDRGIPGPCTGCLCVFEQSGNIWYSCDNSLGSFANQSWKERNGFGRGEKLDDYCADPQKGACTCPFKDRNPRDKHDIELLEHMYKDRWFELWEDGRRNPRLVPG